MTVKIVPLLAGAIIILTACGRNETGTDYQVLCKPDTLEAYHSAPRGAYASLITRVENADTTCLAALTKGEGK